jgi:formylglycine-generating enzyme required for sulfatase activity
LTVCPMRRVRGNHDRDYVFGGRVDAEEEELFRVAGLGLYNPFSTPKSWQAVCAPGEIADFYLDEREVSAAEMLAFIRATDGWDNPRTWPDGDSPPPSRREELAARFAASEQDMPATDVTWDEANAYAHWAGKRLQSWVEWEYALRGGTRYRPWAGCGEGSPLPRPTEINYFGSSLHRGPWSSQRGLDITSDTGIAHLSDNVSEWTATPVGEAKGEPMRSTVIAPATTVACTLHERFWVVGGSFALTAFDFSVADRRKRTWHGADVGFRCALSAADLSRSDSGATPRIHYKSIDTVEAGPSPEATVR